MEVLQRVQESSLKRRPDTEPEKILCHCIRCGHVIPSTHEYVYCGRCMDSWQRYSNMRYVEPEGHCYICGKQYNASAEKPACIECYKTHTKLIGMKCDSMRKAAESKI